MDYYLRFIKAYSIYTISNKDKKKKNFYYIMNFNFSLSDLIRLIYYRSL